MEFIEIEWDSNRYREEIDLRYRLLRAPLGLTFTPEQLKAESGELHFGILEEESLIACAVVVPLSIRQTKLRQMVVDSAFQKRGIGSRLIHGIERELRGRGFIEVELNAREAAVPFYQRLGYEIEGDSFIEVSIPHFKMKRSIALSSGDQ
jgi:predicted GNAT family N-acyltransferase